MNSKIGRIVPLYCSSLEEIKILNSKRQPITELDHAIQIDSQAPEGLEISNSVQKFTANIKSVGTEKVLCLEKDYLHDTQGK